MRQLVSPALTLLLAASAALSAHAASATFVLSDAATRGNWKGVYGQDGNVIAQHSVSAPPYATFNTGGNINLKLVDLWATDPRAPLKATYSYTPDERVESYFHTLTSMDFLIASNDSATRRIALYFCNFQSEPRSEILQVFATATGTLLDSRPVAGMDGGVYLVYDYSGNVTFRVVNSLSGAPTAAVSAFFWGGAPGSTPPAPPPPPPPLTDTTPPTVSIALPLPGVVSGAVTITADASDNVGISSVEYLLDGFSLGSATAPPYAVNWVTGNSAAGIHTLTAIARDLAGNSATSAPVSVSLRPGAPLTGPVRNTVQFLGADVTTLGAWKGIYGVDGNVIAQHSVSIPSYATFDTAGEINLRLMDLWSTDPWALLKQSYSYSPTERVASEFFTATRMDFKIGANDGQQHRVAFYMADLERRSPHLQILAIDPSNGVVMDVRNVDVLYSAPAYMSYSYTGNVTFAVVNTDPRGPLAPAVLNGIFWGYTPAGPPPDHIAPVVTFASPSDGATVSGTIPVAFTATDDSGVIANYQINVDSLPFCASSGCFFDTTRAPDGQHSITALATDRAGNVGSKTIYVTVKNTVIPAPPTLSLLSPLYGATVSGTVSITAVAESPVGFRIVQFQLDGRTLMGTNFPPYSMSWNTTASSNGPHTLTVTATDNLGRTVSAVNPVTVSNAPDTEPPVVTFTSPAPGSSVQGTVTVSFSATDNFGVSGLAAHLDGGPIPASLSGSPIANSIVWDSRQSANGPHTITITASDAAGHETTASLPLIVNNPAPGTGTASFLRADEVTKGNWKGVYGSEGYFIAEWAYNAPPYSMFNAINTNRLLFDIWSNDPRGLLKPTPAYSPDERVISHWYSPTSMDFQVSATDGKLHRIALYFADWQPLGPPAAYPKKRSIVVVAMKTDTGEILDFPAVSDYTGGVYFVFQYGGNVTFRINNNWDGTGGYNPGATLSAVFWDPLTLN